MIWVVLHQISLLKMETDNIVYLNTTAVKDMNFQMLELIKVIEAKVRIIKILVIVLIVLSGLMFFSLLLGYVHFWNYCPVSVSSLPP